METLKSGEIRTGEGRHPSQIVLRLVKPQTYATHLQVIPPDAEPYFILGHYFFTLEEAEKDFLKRDLELGSVAGGSVKAHSN